MDPHDIGHWCAVVTDFSLIFAVALLHWRARDNRRRIDALADDPSDFMCDECYAAVGMRCVGFPDGEYHDARRSVARVP